MSQQDDPRDQTGDETAGGPLEDPQTHLDTDPVNQPDDEPHDTNEDDA